MLIIVLWVAFGLVSLALYFAQSMGMELRAADNRCGAIQAGAAIRGAVSYLTNILATMEEGGMRPDPLTYHAEGVPVGEATFWLIGRSDRRVALDRVVFSMGDESAKLDLNTASAAMLQGLPLMTPELAAAIVDWRDTDSDVTTGGAEDEVYLRLNPAYHCKNAPFESVEELRLVFGMTLEVLYGEDANLNGVLDPNENDGDESAPADNRDGRLDAGLMEYVTVYSRGPMAQSDGTALVNVSESTSTNLAALLVEYFGTARANQIQARLTVGGTSSNLLQFYAASGMTLEEFQQIEGDLTSSVATTGGLVNVNTAPEAVLACIPGIGPEKAAAVVARRASNAETESSLAWVSEVLEGAELQQAGPYLTGRSYQCVADIGAVGRFGRGWQRVRFIIDTAEGLPKIVHRRDLTSLGWALGQDIRTRLVSANNSRQ